ncbi:ferredoxin [Hymenobacter psoromatis]|nr:ferredoxin [Hymenobacter psoromatis]
MPAQNQSLLDALNACVASCENCATAGLRGDDIQMMARCIELDRDCADFCALTARFVARGSEHAQHLLDECAEICKACGDECEKHAAHMEHCRECAEACRRCEQACRQGMSVAA